MTITSAAIDADGRILPLYTCDDKNISPPFKFSEVPVEATSLLLIMEDPDAPKGIFTHWLLYDMPVTTLFISEGQSPLSGQVGKNDFGEVGYGGPCPPSGTHRYQVKLYALDALLGLPQGSTKQEVLGAAQGHIIDQAEIIGMYTRQ